VPRARAVVLDKPFGTFSVEEFEVPDPQPGTVLLRMELSGCCATDVHTYLGEWNTTFPVMLGHENVGRVEAVGAGGQHDYLGHSLQPGDRVFARWGWCGECLECTALRQPRRCRNRPASHAGAPMPFSGGFAEYLYLNAPRTTFMLAMRTPASTAVLSEPLGVAVTAVRRAQPLPGDTVVVQGSGAIGLLTLGVARQSGAARIICVGGPAQRLEVARAFGADAVVDIGRLREPEERTRAVLDETPGGIGADVVFGCVGLAPAWSEGITFLRDGGRFMELGLASDTGEVRFNPATQLVARNLTFMGTLGLSDYQDAVAAGRILEAGRLPFEQLVSHQLPLERVGDAIEALNSNYQLDGETALKIAIAPNGRAA
jgi:threonine dehydrogenase-like Zn-dependent dehydrogenase